MTMLDFKINCFLLLSQSPSLNCESSKVQGLKVVQFNKAIN